MVDFPSDAQLASWAVAAGAKAKDVVALLENIDRWKSLGLVHEPNHYGDLKREKGEGR